MNEHMRYQELISRMLDEELLPEEQDALALHLKDCPDCAALYAAFSALSESIGADLEEPPEGLRENVMAQIRREEIRKKNTGRRHWGAYLSVAAVVALVIFAAPRLRMGSSAAPAVYSMAASAAGAYQETVAEEPAAASAEADMADADYEEAAVETADRAMGSNGAEPVFDLSQRLSTEELAAFLGSSEEAPAVALTPEERFATVLTRNGSVELYLHDGDLLYALNAEDIVSARCGLEEFLDFARN